MIAPNGLYGSMAIGGAALALELRGKWPRIALNETHPKVLYRALTGDAYDRDHQATAGRLGKSWSLNLSKVKNENEIDAVISAWATRQGLNCGWTDLLSANDSLVLPIPGVTYLWPGWPSET